MRKRDAHVNTVHEEGSSASCKTAREIGEMNHQAYNGSTLKLRKIFLLTQCCVLFLCISTTAQATVEIEIEELKKDSYFEAGIVFGTPAGINALVGYCYNPVGVRLTGMYSNENMNGIHLALVYMVSEGEKSSHHVGIALGRSQDPGCDYYYSGPVYDYYYKHFFLEAGGGKILHVNRGDFSSLPYWIILQIGYVHRF